MPHAYSEAQLVEQPAIGLFSTFPRSQPATPVLIESVTAVAYNLLFIGRFLFKWKRLNEVCWLPALNHRSTSWDETVAARRLCS